MKRLILALFVVAAMTAMAACTNTDSSAVKDKAKTAASSPQNQAALKAAQEQVTKCIPQGSLLTKDGRQKIYDCVAPPAQQQALKTCVLNVAGKANLATKAGRAKFRDEDLPNCIVQTQKGAK